jgi:hypothetical protein
MKNIGYYTGLTVLGIGLLVNGCNKEAPKVVETSSNLGTKTEQVTLSPRMQDLERQFANGYTVTKEDGLLGLYGIAIKRWSYLHGGVLPTEANKAGVWDVFSAMYYHVEWSADPKKRRDPDYIYKGETFRGQAFGTSVDVLEKNG